MFRILFIALFFAFHPVHVTLMSLEYSPEDQKFVGFLQVYYDDFLVDYQNMFGFNPQGDITADPASSKEIIMKYLVGKVRFYAGETELKPELSDIILNNNELRMSLNYPVKKESDLFRIKNSILTDIYNDQSNLLIFRYGEFEEGVKLSSLNKEREFKIK